MSQAAPQATTPAQAQAGSTTAPAQPRAAARTAAQRQAISKSEGGELCLGSHASTFVAPLRFAMSTDSLGCN